MCFKLWDSSAVLDIPTTSGEWIRIDGFVVSNGFGEGKAGGIHCQDTTSSTRVELNSIVFQDHQSDYESTALFLFAQVHGIRMTNILVKNMVGGAQRNILAGALGSVYLESLHFDGTNDVGMPAAISALDSLVCNGIIVHDYQIGIRNSIRLGGHDYTFIRDIDVYNMIGNRAPIVDFGSGHTVVRNLHFHENRLLSNPNNYELVRACVVGAPFLDIDSVLIENNFTAIEDVVSFQQPRDDANLYPTGSINHLIVRNNQSGDSTMYDGGFIGRIANIRACNLRNSIFTGNTSVLPVVGPGDQTLSFAGVLHMYHSEDDTLYIENVEFSHNVLLDHDDYSTINYEDIIGNLGRALYLRLDHSAGAFMRNCVFHDNRQPNHCPETDLWYSLGSTVHVFSDDWGQETHLVVEDCSFTDNDDGAFQSEWRGYTFLRNCEFRNNRRYALWLAVAAADIRNVLIESTIAESYALQQLQSRQNAILLGSRFRPAIIRNCTIVNNQCQNLLTTTFQPYDPTEIENCIIVGNEYESLTTFVNDPEEDQPTFYNNCFLQENVTHGQANFVNVDPQFNEQLGIPWLSSESPCIDTGLIDQLYNDLEDPDNLGFALWPSQGSLRNDIGYTGGPHAGTLENLVGIVPPVYERLGIVESFVLFPAYPNPFNPRTTIPFYLPQMGHTEVSVYNLRGQRVRTLLDKFLVAGEHTVVFEAGILASGVYLIQLKHLRGTEQKKVLLLK